MNYFIIPVELCDLNTYINAERSNRHIAAKIKKENTEICKLYCKQLNLDMNKQYDVIINWHTKDKRKDSDNVYFGSKFIFDGVVKAGKLLGDGYKQIRNVHNNRFIGDSRVEIIFTEAVCG